MICVSYVSAFGTRVYRTCMTIEEAQAYIANVSNGNTQFELLHV